LIPNFYYHPRMMEYDFGPNHPLKPIRLMRTEALLRAFVPDLTCIDPGLAEPEEVGFAHSQDYIEVVQALSTGEQVSPEVLFSYGFGSVDTPPFKGMFGAALAYCGGAVRAAEDLLVGEEMAFPGTGFVEETGAGGAIINIPLEARTTGDTWLWAFTDVFRRAMDWYKPEAIVLQMGCDAHINDPLGHLAVTVQEWLAAVRLVKNTGLPILGCGGGGYAIENVPRMWAAAVMELSGIEVPARAPDSIPKDWGVSAILDAEPGDRWIGRPEAEKVVEYWRQKLV